MTITAGKVLIQPMRTMKMNSGMTITTGGMIISDTKTLSSVLRPGKRILLVAKAAALDNTVTTVTRGDSYQHAVAEPDE